MILRTVRICVPRFGKGGCAARQLVTIAGGVGARQHVVENVGTSSIRQCPHNVMKPNIARGHVVPVLTNVVDEMLQNAFVMSGWHHAVNDQAEILLDGGIRRGSDIVKAICYGARAVLIGRACAYGLAAGGQAGVTRALEILHADVERTLKLLGCLSITALAKGYTGRLYNQELKDGLLQHNSSQS